MIRFRVSGCASTGLFLSELNEDTSPATKQCDKQVSSWRHTVDGGNLAPP